MPFPNTTATTGQVVTAAFWNDELKDNFDTAFPDGATSVDWSPVLEGTVTDPTAAVNGQRYRMGAVEDLWARFNFTAGGAGTYFVTLPNAAVGITASASVAGGQIVGTWVGRNNSVPQGNGGFVLLRAAGEIHFNTVGSLFAGSTVPWSWASDDILSFHVRIPIA